MFKKITAAACLLLTPGLAGADGHITGDPDLGERVFRKCQACHAVGPEAENKAGPVLNGIVDRAVASVEGFSYSDALTNLASEGTVWSPEELAAFLERPRSYASGTKMAFPGLRKEEERVNIIAYLSTFP